MPNTLTQLNDFSDSAVVFNDQRSYSIAFSANSAVNTSTSIVEDQVFVVPTGIDITNVISQPGNITYTVFAGNVGNVVGSWPSPLPAGVSNTSSGNAFTITGTFSAETWNYAKNLTLVYPDRDDGFSFTANLTYPNVSNPSTNRSFSWTNGVTVTGTNPETLTLTTDYNWAEDNATKFVYSIDDLDPTANFTVTFDQFSGTPGIITVNGVSAGLGNTATITGNRATVNAANVLFNPFPDATDNVQVYVSAGKTNPFGTFVFSNNVVANLNCTSTHAEYTLTTAYNYTEDVSTTLAFDITDTDPTTDNYTVSISQVSGDSGLFFVNGVNLGAGNSVVISNTKANINAANVTFVPRADSTSTVGLTYTQSKMTPLFGNIVQANAVAITLTNNSSHADYSLTTAYNYTEDQKTVLAFDITDTDATVNNYTVSFEQVSGNTGLFLLDGVSQGLGNSVTITDSKANINAANVTFVPFPDTTSTVGITYNQVKSDPLFGNIVQANNVAITLTNTVSHAEYTLPPGGTYSEDRFLVFGNVVTDLDPEATSYTMSIRQTEGTPGQWYKNNEFGQSVPVTPNSNAYLTLSFTNSAANINSQNIKFFPRVDDNSNIAFVYNQSKINDLFGPFMQADAVVAEYTCIPNGEVTNLADGSTRTYQGNATTRIFSTSTPQLDDGDDIGQIYRIRLEAAAGRFSSSASPTWLALTSSLIGEGSAVANLEIFGNTTVINNAFANISYVPNPQQTSNTSFVYKQFRSGVLQTTRNITLNHVPNALNTNVTKEYTLPVNQSISYDSIFWTPTVEQAYYGNIHVLIACGGGGAGATSGGGGGWIKVDNFCYGQNTTRRLIPGNNYQLAAGDYGRNSTSQVVGGGLSAGVGGNGSFIRGTFLKGTPGSAGEPEAIGFYLDGPTAYRAQNGAGSQYQGGAGRFVDAAGTVTNYTGGLGGTVFVDGVPQGGGGASAAANGNVPGGADGYLWPITGQRYGGGGGGQPGQSGTATPSLSDFATGGTRNWTSNVQPKGGIVVVAIR